MLETVAQRMLSHILLPFISDRADIQPFENILCSVDISEKGAKCGYLMVRIGILNVLKPALSITDL